jgi:hypothetical protein
MKKELREPIKDTSIFDNEYFKVVFRQHIKTLYVKCNKLTFNSIDSWVYDFNVDGFLIEESYNNETYSTSYEIFPKHMFFFIHQDDLETDIQFISKEEFDEVKQRVIDILS